MTQTFVEKQWFESITTSTFNITIQSKNNTVCIHWCKRTTFCGCTLKSKGKTKQGGGKRDESNVDVCESVSVFPLCCIFPREQDIQQTTAVSKQSKQITQSTFIVT